MAPSTKDSTTRSSRPGNSRLNLRIDCLLRDATPSTQSGNSPSRLSTWKKGTFSPDFVMAAWTM